MKNRYLVVIFVFIFCVSAQQPMRALPKAPSTLASQIRLICSPTSLPGGETWGGKLNVGTCDSNPAGNTFLLIVGGISPSSSAMYSVHDDHNPSSNWIGPVSCATSTDKNGGNNYFYYLKSSVPASYGINITVQATNYTAFTSAMLVEVRGLDLDGMIDQCVSNSYQSASWTIHTPTVTTRYANELLLTWGSCQYLANNMATGYTNWTFLKSRWGMTGVGGCQGSVRLVNTIGTFKAQYDQTGSGTFANSFVSLVSEGQ